MHFTSSRSLLDENLDSDWDQDSSHLGAIRRPFVLSLVPSCLLATSWLELGSGNCLAARITTKNPTDEVSSVLKRVSFPMKKSVWADGEVNGELGRPVCQARVSRNQLSATGGNVP